MNYFEAIPGILIVETNLDDFKWSYGLCMPKSTESDFEKSLLKITLRVERGNLWSDSERSSITNKGKFHYFSGDNNADEIYYDRNFMFNRRFQYKLSGLNSNHITMVVNKAYYKYVTHRFMNVHSVGYILTDIVNLKLLHNGLCPIHCSAVEHPEKGTTVIFAPPNTGKTLTSMKLCMELGYNYMAEDLALTDGENVYSVPWTSTFRYYSDIDKSKWSQFLSKLTEKISFVELLGLGKVESIDKYISPEQFTFKAKVSDLAILERGEGGIVRGKSPEHLLFMMHTLDRYEFNYMRAPAVIAYSYFNPSVDIQKAQDTEVEVLRTMLNNSSDSYLVRSDSALDYFQLIHNK